MKAPCLKWVFVLTLVAGGTLSARQVLHAQRVSGPTEYQVKAAFLYNFAKFVDWPPDAFKNSGGSFVIGVLGDDPFGNDLDQELIGKTVQDKTLVLKRITQVKEASDCLVLFISPSEENRVETLLAALENTPVLTISDMKSFISKGGMIGFSIENNKVRFSINLEAAEKAGLKISSQLLKLAKTIKGSPAVGNN